MATAAGAASSSGAWRAARGGQGATSTRELALARRENAGQETRVPHKLFRPARTAVLPLLALAGAAPAGAAPC